MASPLKAAILIVSTTAAKDPSADASSSVLRDVFASEGDGKWKVAAEHIVADDAVQIQKQIMLWTDGPEPLNLIITTGGTGFALSDTTPEVRSQLQAALGASITRTTHFRQSRLYYTSKRLV